MDVVDVLTVSTAIAGADQHLIVTARWRVVIWIWQ